MDRKNRIVAGIAVAFSVGIAFIVFAVRGCMDTRNEPESETHSSQQLETHHFSYDNNIPTIEETVFESDYEKSVETVYVLKLQEGVVTIYTDTGEFYDYAQINTALLPEEVESELRMGMEVIGEEGLYEFLQGYAD